MLASNQQERFTSLSHTAAWRTCRTPSYSGLELALLQDLHVQAVVLGGILPYIADEAVLPDASLQQVLQVLAKAGK